MRFRLLAAAGLCLSTLPSAASAYELCTDALLFGGSRQELEANIEIGGVTHQVTLQFGMGKICGAQATDVGPIRAKTGRQPDWTRCDGEVPAPNAGVTVTGEAPPRNPDEVTIALSVQYTSEAGLSGYSPYHVIGCRKD